MLVGNHEAGATPESGAPTIPLRARSVAAERARQFIKDHPALMRAAESFWRAVDSVPPPVGTLLQSVKQRMLRETGLAELLVVIETLESEGIPYWLAGGWGVDVLLRRKTRRHKDIDVVIGDFEHNEPKARRAFLALGFSHVDIDEGGVWMPTRSNFADEAGHRIEVLGIDWERVRGAWGSDAGGRSSPDAVREQLADEVFTTGMMSGREVPCLSARAQLLFHTGFTLEAGGRQNVSLLRSEFGATT